jgi:hypothetical protein
MGKLITMNRYIEELTIEIHPLWGPQCSTPPSLGVGRIGSTSNNQVDNEIHVCRSCWMMIQYEPLLIQSTF